MTRDLITLKAYSEISGTKLSSGSVALRVLEADILNREEVIQDDIHERQAER